MKYAALILLLLVQSFESISQEKKPGRFSLTATAGLNEHSYTKSYTGWYIKLGAEYRLWKGLSGGIRLWHSAVDEFPARLKSVPFSADDEANFLQSFIGITKEEWEAPVYKGFYHFIEGDILSFSLGYEFKIKNSFFITPRYAISFLRSRFLIAGIYDAFFVNNRLANGKVFYDIRMGNLSAGSIGFEIGYKLNKQWKLFAEWEDIRDINGTGFIFFDAKTYGAGIKYSFK
ncbi:MAG: hypothetical protein ABI688_10780 [Bacteroidota bacterium]